jgi:flagellin
MASRKRISGNSQTKEAIQGENMAFSINTNIASLQAQEYLRVGSEFQSKTINRVTSGLRIINSGDDAAGLAIANGFRSDRAVLMQGVRNANDGLSTLQTIDGGINNISQLLDRARTLAAQSASGTFNGSRSLLDSEFQSVITEIDRQAKSIGLNSGGDFNKSLSVFIGGGRGADGDAVITNGSVSVDMSNSAVDSKSLGLKAYRVTGVADLSDGVTLTADLNFKFYGSGFGETDGEEITVTVNTTGVEDAQGLVDAINSTIASYPAASVYGTRFKDANITASIVTGDNGEKYLAFDSTTTAFGVVAVEDEAGDLLATAGANANYRAYSAGVQYTTASYTPIADGSSQTLTFSVVDANGALHTLDVALTSTGSTTTAAEAAQMISAALYGSNDEALQSIVAVANTAGDEIRFMSTSPEFSVTIARPDDDTATGVNDGTVALLDSDADGDPGSLSISTADLAEAAVTALGNAVAALGEAQAVVGKGQNTFNYAISLASTQLTNLTAAESRIRDADLAMEAANLTKAQVLQQAGIAALAQANASTQAVLSLLRG